MAFELLSKSGLSKLEEVEAAGHRIVHGGEYFHESVLIDEGVAKRIEALSELAPLHNPENLKGYYASKRLLPHAKQVAVFDTSFHQTLPPKAYLYGIPYVYYTRDKIRRYGFHGTSHRYVSHRFAQLHNSTRAKYRLITCHLGNGCSLCAIEYGKSVDTSMGFTPMEGLLMGTRSGDIDPGAVLYLVEHDEGGAKAIENVLNEQSGLAGISGVLSDMREVLDASRKGNAQAAAAVDVFCYRVKKYIGAYLAAMNGADAIIFTGGIGEKSATVRARICESMDALGIRIDAGRNESALGTEQIVSENGAAIQVWVIPTDEELLIARDTLRVILGIPHP